MLRQILVLVLLGSSVVPALAQGGPTPAEQAACNADRTKFCASVKPGGGRVVDCLAGHKAELADGCRKVLESHGK
jgi:hypothetical protein